MKINFYCASSHPPLAYVMVAVVTIGLLGRYLTFANIPSTTRRKSCLQKSKILEDRLLNDLK